MKVLFVCTGNTCRSPMAEALLKDKLPHAKVRSAGIFASEGVQANTRAVEVLKKRGITLHHQSQPVSLELLNWADLVLTMTVQHKQSLIMQYPDVLEKFYTVKEYVSNSDIDVFQKLKETYANYQEKRAQYIRENAHQDNRILDDMLSKEFAGNINQIQQLELELINYNISDPFGGDLYVYEKTLEELESHLSILVSKLQG